MNTSQLKLFAQEARDILLQGVQNRLLFWGFDQKGFILEKPEEIPGGFIFRGEVYDDPGILRKWHHLHSHIQKHSVKDALEQAAYTWFNRLIALSILEHNRLENPIIIAILGQSDPPILANAKQGKMGFLSPIDQERVRDCILDHNDEKAFGTLLVGFCRSHTLLNRVFGSIDDFTELLLPNNLLSSGGILDHINSSRAITNDDYKEVELIGWLYQFYISERKDEVFAGFRQKKKARTEDIPAATQFFTPRWIVKYMVENTLGKIWLEHSPESAIRGSMQYLVENEHSVGPDLIKSVIELKLFDPAVGSGHILVEGFDLFLQMYKEEGYTTKSAVNAILNNNLFGLDIDDRASQLGCFAVLLKASQYDPEILKKDILPKIFALPEVDLFSREEILEFLGFEGEQYYNEFSESINLLQQGKNIGSALKVKILDESRNFLQCRLSELQNKQMALDIQLLSILNRIRPFIEVLLVITDSYYTIATNPPYMGHINMNVNLKNYIDSNYPLSKADLFAVFIEVCQSFCHKHGLIGMINQHHWMFISSYEGLRGRIIQNNNIESMIHLGTRTFEEISGEKVQSTSFILRKEPSFEYGKYYRLVDYKSNSEKEKAFLEKQNQFESVNKNLFSSIPRQRIGYWLTNSFLSVFKNDTLDLRYSPKSGVLTGNDPLFVRNWHEVSFKKIKFNLKSHSEMLKVNPKWTPITNGGTYRKWFGNFYNVVDLENNGHNIKSLDGNNYRLRNPKYYFQHGINWTLFLSGDFSVRESPVGVLFGNGSRTFFPDHNNFKYLLALFNTIIVKKILEMYNPTTNFNNEDIADVPVIYSSKFENKINLLTDDCLKISNQDWNRKETSWDFQKSILLNGESTIEKAYLKWIDEITQCFFRLHSNEQELNRIFIGIYGLQDELIHEVPLIEISILQDELDRNKLKSIEGLYRNEEIVNVKLPLWKDEIIRQFLSYLVGCILGRYRLDKSGLYIAHSNSEVEELNTYIFNNHPIEIDQDAIIPILGDESPFSDDLSQRVRSMIEAIWGEETLTENINFIEEAISMTLEKFLMTKFWDYHKKMYNKTPIYWMFESPKGSFRVLTYMHRMDKYTVQKIRLNYLQWFMDNHLSIEIDRLKRNGDNPRKLEKLENALIDCRDYSDILKPLSDHQITFDLDDGVKKNYKLFEGAVKPI